MNAYKLLICCLTISGCSFNYENNSDCNARLTRLEQEADSLKNEIHKLTQQKNNDAGSTQDTIDGTKKTIGIQDPVSKKNSLENKPAKKVQQQQLPEKSDTIFYFYTNTKKVSVKIDPRKKYGGKNKIRFYDPAGKITFEQEDVFESYSISTEIKAFHPNGAVDRIVIHLNPGGSMHWYETIITFDTENTPLWKEEITYPQKLNDTMDNRYYWDNSKKQWI